MGRLIRKSWPEGLLFLFVLGTWLFWAFLLPLNEGPDENMRLQIVQFILEYRKLPTGWQKEIMDYTWGFTYGFRPILPQLLEALFVWGAMLFTKDAFSLLFAARLASIFCGIVFFWYVWKLGGVFFEKRIHRQLFLMLNVCLPQSVFLFTYLNCDSMALMASAMILYYLLRGERDSYSVRTCMCLGGSLSLCVLSYYNAYGFLVTGVLIFGGFFLDRIRKGEKRQGEFWWKGFLILGLVLALTGWWFVRNYRLYDGDFLGLKTQEACAQRYAMDIFKPSGRRNGMNMGMSLGDMLFRTDWVILVFKGFVGVLAPLTEARRDWIFVGYGLLFLVGGLGILWECVGGLRGRRCLDVFGIGVHLGLVVAVVLPNALNVWYSYSNDYQPQGRYSMPMLVPFMYYVVRGVGFFGTRVQERWGERGKNFGKIAGRLVCWWMVLVLGFCSLGIMWPAYQDVENKAEVRVYGLEELFGGR